MRRLYTLPQLRFQRFLNTKNALITICILILLCAAQMGCSSGESRTEKKAKEVKPAQSESSVIDALKTGGSHSDTIPVFKDYHDVLHLLNGFTKKGEHEPIGMLLPYLRHRLEKLADEEGKLATRENRYKSYLDKLHWQTQEFIFTYDQGSYDKLRGAFKRMHDAYDDVKRNRPGGPLPIKG